MVNDPLMDEERKKEKKQSQVIKPVDNFIPYDPNTDQERSSGESFNSGLTAPILNPKKTEPVIYNLEKASDPRAETSSASSYIPKKKEIEDFRKKQSDIQEEELLKLPKYKEGENPLFINEDEKIINPSELESLNKRNESYLAERSDANKPIQEFNEGIDEYGGKLDSLYVVVEEKGKALDTFTNQATENDLNSDIFWNEYNKRFLDYEKTYLDYKKQFEMYEKFSESNLAFLNEKNAPLQNSLDEKYRGIERDYESIEGGYFLPPEISSGDIYDRDLETQKSFYLETPGDIYDRDIPYLKDPINYVPDPDLTEDFISKRQNLLDPDYRDPEYKDPAYKTPDLAAGFIKDEEEFFNRRQNLLDPYYKDPDLTEDFISKREDSYNKESNILEPNFSLKDRIARFELGSIVGRGDSALSPTVGGVGKAGSMAASGAWILSGADYLLDQARNTPNLRVFNPKGFTEDEVKKGDFFDKARNTSDLDDYLVSIAGQVERGINIIPRWRKRFILEKYKSR